MPLATIFEGRREEERLFDDARQQKRSAFNRLLMRNISF
jgi:hypothetical protein